MDPVLNLRISEKMQDIVDQGGEIRIMANMLSPDATDDFVGGMIAGRLYNSFYYQCRRIKKRDPKPEEVAEFLAMMADEWNRLMAACRL